MPKQTCTAEQIDAILQCGREGLDFKATAARVGVAAPNCRYHLKKAGYHRDRPAVTSEAHKVEMRRMVEAGASIPDISKALDLDPALIRHHLTRMNVPLPQPARARVYTTEQKNTVLELRHEGRSTKAIVDATEVKAGSVRSYLSQAGVTLTREQLRSVMQRVSQENRDKIAEMRIAGLPEREILAAVPVSRTTMKEVLRGREITVARDVATRNSQATLLAKNPDHMAHMRSAMTEEHRKRAGEAIKAFYRDHPEVAERIGRRSSAFWAALSPEEKRQLRPGGRSSIAHRHMLNRNQVDNADELMARYAAHFNGVYLGPTYVGNKDPVAFRCERGHEFRMIPNRIQQGAWCPHCSRGLSRPQLEIYEYVLSLDPEATVNEHFVLKGVELDIYSPAANLAIELDGLYWHSSALENFQRGRSMKKALRAQAAGLKYMMVFEDEWVGKRDLVKTMIAVRMGAFAGRRLDARSLEIRDVPRANANEFFERSHLSGAVGFRYAVGLYEGEFLACCVAMRTTMMGEPEIARLATSPEALVRGGAARLVAEVRRREVGAIVSYSDNRLSSGEVYRKMGFREATLSQQPSYFYTDFQTRLWRFRCRRINDPAVRAAFPTEEAQALGGVFSRIYLGHDKPLYRIEDCGHRRWVLDPPSPKLDP